MNASVTASYGCVDSGSGLAVCGGTVPSGTRIDTSAIGTKTLQVTGYDAVGNGATTALTYTVVAGSGPTSTDVGIALSAPPKVSRGGTMTYVMTVTNARTGSATGVVVSNALPAGTAFASASTSQGSVTAPGVGSNGTVSASIGTLAPGATAQVSVVVAVTATSGTVLTDTATVLATTPDSNSNNNSAAKTTTVKN